MAMKIGIFESESQAIEAVQALEQEGFTNTEIKVLSKNREHSSRIESETNVHAEEIDELVDTREYSSESSALGLGIIPPAGLTGGMYAAGMLNGSGGPYGNGAALVGAGLMSDDDSMKQALSSLGLASDSLSACPEGNYEWGPVVAADMAITKEMGTGLNPRRDCEAPLRQASTADFVSNGAIIEEGQLSHHEDDGRAGLLFT